MKFFHTWLLLLLASSIPRLADGQPQLLVAQSPQHVFVGKARQINTVWQNNSDQIAEYAVRARIWQTSSSTAVKIGDVPWKTLQVLPRQTVLESATLDFPMIKAKTKFLVQWCELTNHVIGTTEVQVYPTNLLAELKLLTPGGDQIPGVLDPRHELRPPLKSAGVKFVNLEEMSLDNFSGPLAVIGPCDPGDPEWNGLTRRVSRLAQRGTAVVWIQSSPQKSAEIRPSYYIVPKSRAVIVVVDPALIANLPDQPQSQLNLIYFCKLALQPEPFQLPELTDYTKL